MGMGMSASREKSSVRGLLVGAALLLLGPATARASLIYSSDETLTGTGLGSVTTVLTIQASPSESGCVKWNGSNDTHGSPCPGGVAGGDEKTSQSQTRAFSEIGLTNAASLRVIFNAAESDSAIILNKLIVTFYAADGTPFFSSGAFTPVDFPDTVQGVGGAGEVFKLDAAQAATANAVAGFNNPTNRIGLSAAAGTGTGAQQSGDGPETFFIANAACPTITVSPNSLSTGTVGTAYPAVTFTATGGATPITWSHTPAGPFGGVSFSDAAGTLSPGGETPTSSGSFPLTVTATDANGCTGSVNLLLVINPASCEDPIIISPPTIPNATNGVFYSQAFTASGGTSPYAFAAELAGAPLGIEFDPATATLSGTPTQVGSFVVIISVTDDNGCANSRTYSLVVNSVSPTVSAPALQPRYTMLLAVAMLVCGTYVVARSSRKRRVG